MKRLIIFSFFLFIAANLLPAQENEAGVLNLNERSVGFATGIDYSIFPIELSYRQGIRFLSFRHPVSIGTAIAIPMFELDPGDIRVHLTSDATLWRKGMFQLRGGIDPVLINTKMETEVMTSIGADAHIFAGTTSKKWNIGAEIRYNQVFSTYIRHRDKYRENVFAEAVDGWYKLTASNIRTGLWLERRFGSVDLLLKGGLSQTGQFNSYLFVPTLYTTLGVSYRF